MFAPATQARALVRRGRGQDGPSAIWAVYAVMAALVVAYLVLLFSRPTNQSSTLIDGWGVDAFEITAGILCIVGGRRRRPDSAVPIVLGIAILCWALGDTILTIESLGGATPPQPSYADASYLLFFPLSYVAAMLFVRGETRQLSSPSWLDGAVAGLGAGAVLAAFAFRIIEHSAQLSGLALIVNLAYPVGDVLLLLLVVGGTAVMSGRRKGPWLLLAAGFAVNILGDTSNLLNDSLGGAHLGTIIDASAWPISTLFMSMAMSLRPGLADPLTPQKPPGFLLPGLAAAAGLGVLFLSTVGSVNHVATALATGTLVLVVVRTSLSVRQLRHQTKLRQQQSVTDHLTGLANRRRLFDALEAFFAEDARDRPKLAFLFIDLTGFKRINDSFGHPVGDEILMRVAARLENSLRPSDLLARVGGDEFAAMLVNTSTEEAITVAGRLSASLDEPFTIDAVSAEIGASIGIALAPEDADDGEGLMWCADAAMYRAKLASDRLARYERTIDRGGNKLRLADELSTAIDADQLLLHYQPQLDLRTGEIATVEALIRWEHPEHGMIQPLMFLPLAEEAGLMGLLTRWVLTTALAQCAAWRAAGRGVRVSVNISAGDLVDPKFADTVAWLLGQARLPPSSLMLEITETSIIEEFERARHAVARLRRLGVHVSIDDFGAGFTSLAYLSDLTVSELKLDRRFISPLAGGVRSRDSDMARATIELGHALGLKVVAEGVEDGGALALLREFGCDIAQGYGIGRPAPAAALKLLPATAPRPAVQAATARPAPTIRPAPTAHPAPPARPAPTHRPVPRSVPASRPTPAPSKALV
jgi:diguanylate cyclase